MKRIALLTLLVACGGEDANTPVVTPKPGTSASATAVQTSGDPLGARPPVDSPKPFTPPTPTVYKRDNGMTVWLVERHNLPIVSMEIVVSQAGANEDPTGKDGTAWIAANMLDEGAGTRDALAISRDVDRLGATLDTGAFNDYAFVHLTTLKKNLGPAGAIMGDVITKPTFSATEWKRVYDLWSNDLVQRTREPAAVANVVMLKKVFGDGRLNAHPIDGTTKSAKSVTLADAQAFYKAKWQPDAATCVVVGDINRSELDAMLDASLSGWKSSGTKTAQAGPVGVPGKTATRAWYVVDRPDAPQSVIMVARKGVAASDPNAAPLSRVNAAIGGSFTSRLNQDLREEHHWTYGASSRFSWAKTPGAFSASAAVDTPHTGVALKAMLTDLDAYAKDGPTDEEVEKTRLIVRGDLVEAFEGVAGASHRLARNAGVGLPADTEATASARLYASTKDDMKKLAATYFDTSEAAIIIVGPRKEIEPQLAKEGFPKPSVVTAEGDGP